MPGIRRAGGSRDSDYRRRIYQRNMRNYIKICAVFCWILALLTLLGGCRRAEFDERKVQESTSIVNADPETLDDITMESLVAELLGNMSLEQKIGQLFIVNTDSLDFNAETAMTKKMRKNIQKYQPGGVIFFSFNFDTDGTVKQNRKKTEKFIRKMQKASVVPMFISVDEEGGTVSRVANTEALGTTKFPPMSEIGATGDAAQAYQVGHTIGSEIAELGFNLDFAPVADINTNADNTEIGNRSFGSDPQLVSDMVCEEVKGLQESGVSAALKHFPGQGNTGDDTHRGFVNLDATIDRLRDVEFQPFQAGIEAGADFVMMSHVAVRDITQNEEPASLSSLMVSDILREELQFDHVIITDAMNMKIITKFYNAGEAAVMAVEAGNDMILMPDDFVEAYEAVYQAVEDGTLTERQIDQAVSRILTVKIRRGILPLSSPLLADIVQ